MTLLEDLFEQHLKDAGIEYEREFPFARPLKRRYRADFFIPTVGLLIEIEGGVFRGNVGHNSIGGIKRDIEKGNLATLLGYKTLRLHTDHVSSGSGLRMVEQVLYAEPVTRCATCNGLWSPTCPADDCDPVPREDV